MYLWHPFYRTWINGTKIRIKRSIEIKIMRYCFFTCHQCQNMSILILSIIFALFIPHCFNHDHSIVSFVVFLDLHMVLTSLLTTYITSTACLNLVIDTKRSMLMCDICLMCYNSVRTFFTCSWFYFLMQVNKSRSLRQLNFLKSTDFLKS